MHGNLVFQGRDELRNCKPRKEERYEPNPLSRGVVLKEKYGPKGIGDTVNCDGMKVKLQDAFLCEPNALFGKDEGKEYLGLAFDIENTTSTDTCISSADFTAYCDEYVLSIFLHQLDQFDHLHGNLSSGNHLVELRGREYANKKLPSGSFFKYIYYLLRRD